MKYKEGDKFVNLVHNTWINAAAGDIVSIVEMDESDMPYGVASDNENDWWWYSSKSIQKFLIPLGKVSEKDLFTIIMTGVYPGRERYVFSEEDADNLDHSRKPVDGEEWKIEYYYGRELDDEIL